ncbi:MAG: sodium:alanine symporter family protein [bacterium]|nr:sodium:alanine symporter family protein [bacterium]
MNIADSINTVTATAAASVEDISNFLWGWPLIILLVGTGLFVSIFFKFVQFRGFKHAVGVLRGKYDDPDDPGEISHFQALSAALSATIGTGNIVGVAAAILVGGPGAVFWMWVTALVGMATKFASCTLAVRFRKIDENGEAHGGPMHYIEQGMGPKFKWLAILFAVFTITASFGIGNSFQIYSVRVNLGELMRNFSYGQQLLGVKGETPLAFDLIVGTLIAILVGLVIVGGIKSIGKFASKIVPLMSVFYVGAGLVILALNIKAIPGAFGTIFHYAFNTPEALAGGLLGTVIRQGVARGLFSNEAGLGSAAMAHGAAQTKEPVREGLVAMLGPFIDTIIICSITALAIIITDVYDPSLVKSLKLTDGNLTAKAFEMGLGSSIGSHIVSVGILFFAFSTMISWSYYGNRAVDYLFGSRSVTVYQLIFCAIIILGACGKINLIKHFCDIMNALMALPNLIALIVLSPIVAALTRDYFKRMKEKKF